MKRKFWVVLALVSLFCFTFAIAVQSGQAQLAQLADFDWQRSTLPGANLLKPEQPISSMCALQPEPKGNGRKFSGNTIAPASGYASPTLSRFRQQVQAMGNTVASLPSDSVASRFQPREEIALIDPTNYGDRYLKDLNGNLAIFDAIVVLHETVGSANSAINFFRTPHPRDSDQASYHTLVRRDGTIVYLVPPDKRAFGAGDSTFNGLSVRTNPDFPGSVNNFAYHVSLESPPDGSGNSYRHSGYTAAQYQSLAWLVAKTGVPNERITTHRAVDRSGTRLDPRSFQFSQFTALLDTYPRTQEISIRCTEPEELPPPQ
jgi:hypothetical protein